MGKGKKNKQHQVVYRALKPIIKDDRIILSLLGAVGLGITLASVTGLNEGQAIITKVKEALLNLEEVTGIKKKKQPKPKKQKPNEVVNNS